MTEPIFAVYGASGFGREVMPLARAEVLARGGSLERLYFIDDRPAAADVNGRQVLSYRDFLRIPASRRLVALAIADSRARERLAGQCASGDIEAWAITAQTAIIQDEVAISAGAILANFVTLGSNTRIGRQFHANVYCYVAHDCEIGDFVTLAPGVRCNGNVRIGDHVYIGAGAVIRQGRPGQPRLIGHGAVIGMGAVVTKDVPEGVTVVGNPAHLLSKGTTAC